MTYSIFAMPLLAREIRVRLKNHGPMTVKELVIALGRPEASINKCLTQLLSNQSISREQAPEVAQEIEHVCPTCFGTGIAKIRRMKSGMRPFIYRLVENKNDRF